MNIQQKKGSNDIKVKATSASGLANLDLIHLSNGVSNANCIITGLTETSSAESGLYVYPNPTQSEVRWHSEQSWILMNSYEIELQKGNGSEADLTGYSN